MNRELKFRIWDKQNKIFIYERDASHKRLAISLVGLVYHGGYDDVLSENDYVIQQYTGMKDRNGVEVYEGDIVAEKITEEMAANGDSAVVGVVYFAAGTFLIDGDGPLYDRTHSLTPDILEDFVVVGNKFTNPELLK